MNLGPFITRAGETARVVACRKHKMFPVVALVETREEHETVVCLTPRGFFLHDETPNEFDIDFTQKPE